MRRSLRAPRRVESSHCRLCLVPRASPKYNDLSPTPPTTAPYTIYRRCMGAAGFQHLERAQLRCWCDCSHIVGKKNMGTLPCLIRPGTTPRCCAPSAPPPNPTPGTHEACCCVHSVLTNRNEPDYHINTGYFFIIKFLIPSHIYHRFVITRATSRDITGV